MRESTIIRMSATVTPYFDVTSTNPSSFAPLKARAEHLPSKILSHPWFLKGFLLTTPTLFHYASTAAKRDYRGALKKKISIFFTRMR